MREAIAVLFGIPATREEFFERAKDSEWDYGRQLARHYGSSDAAFDRAYAPVCSAAHDLISMAEKVHVTIKRQATLSSLEDASAENDTLVVIAHWRGSQMDDCDLEEDWHRCLDNDHPVTGMAVQALARDNPGETLESLSRRRVATCLNQLIADHRPLNAAALFHDEVEMHPLIAEALSRDLIGEALGTGVRAGNQLELFDGLHDVGAIDRALDARFAGVLDLSCCTSSVLGTFLDFLRGGAIDIVSADNLLVPRPHLLLVTETLGAVGELRNTSYQHARRAIARGLGDWRDAR